MELTFEQLAFIAVIASVLISAFKLLYAIAAKRKWNPPSWIQIVVVYIVSGVLAVFWFPQSIPPLPPLGGLDPVAVIGAILNYAGAWIVVLTAYAAGASAVYVVLLKKLQDGLGSKVAPKAFGTVG